jgi:hypothetical protein
LREPRAAGSGPTCHTKHSRRALSGRRRRQNTCSDGGPRMLGTMRRAYALVASVGCRELANFGRTCAANGPGWRWRHTAGTCKGGVLGQADRLRNQIQREWRCRRRQRRDDGT